MRQIAPILLIIISLTNCGCVNFFSSMAYEVEIPQGNLISRTKLDNLETGMTREKVYYHLGSPITERLSQNNEVEYVYLLQDKRAGFEYKKATLVFNEDKLESYIYEEV